MSPAHRPHGSPTLRRAKAARHDLRWCDDRNPAVRAHRSPEHPTPLRSRRHRMDRSAPARRRVRCPGRLGHQPHRHRGRLRRVRGAPARRSSPTTAASYFLATKTGERSGDAARAELERSLERLGVDHVDLIQLHNLVEPDEWDVAHGPGGAVEALAQARDEGLVRFIGVTGHGLRIAGDAPAAASSASTSTRCCCRTTTRARRRRLPPPTSRRCSPLCADRKVAVQTIKSVARRRWPTTPTTPHGSWYEPLPEGDALARAVAYVLAERAAVPQHHQRCVACCRRWSPPPSDPAPPPTDDQLAADAEALGVAPLFDGGELERI